jgi:thioredoxin reductase
METCKHPKQTPKKFQKSNGSLVVKFQCDDCGAGLLESPKHLHNLATLSDFDHQFKRSEEERQAAEARQKWKEQSEQNRQAWFAAYVEYLNSDEWRKVRSIVLERDRVCQVCFCATATQAHHLSYESLKKFGVTFPQECVGICISCHDRFHGKDSR